MFDKGGFNEVGGRIGSMKVDTHSLLLDAALFGSPPAVCRSAQYETATLLPDPSRPASWDGQAAKSDAAEPSTPSWSAE
jgi:hypothetical protein